MSSVLERPGAPGRGERPQPRPLDQIFPLRADATRGPQMQETWLAFCAEMDGAVQGALDGSRSPPEIAYAIGGIVHNYFRTRGLTLTSFELRRLVAELLGSLGAPSPAAAPETPPPPSLVAFEREPAADSQWTGDDAVTPEPTVPEHVFKGPPSRVVILAPRGPAGGNGPLDRVVAGVRANLGLAEGKRPRRAEALDAIATVLAADGVAAEERERLMLLALSELCGLGLIDRLWADRAVRAVFVNAPDAVWVDRDGTVEPAREAFRDQAHLLDLVGRLARPTPDGVVSFRLRDGSEGTIVFPPAAPEGPVMVLRRGRPGLATFDRLIAAEVLSRAMADLLRIAARSRLNIVVVGPEGSGKTALLAAILRDLAQSRRTVTLARHREFAWPSASKVELVAATDGEPGPRLAALVEAALRLQPDVAAVDSVRPDDLVAVNALLSRPGRGVIAALAPDSASAAVVARADLMVRLGRAGDGLFRVAAISDSAGAPLFALEAGGFRRLDDQPSFARTVRQAGYGDALASALR